MATGGTQGPLASGDGDADASVLESIGLEHGAHGIENEILRGNFEPHPFGGVLEPLPVPGLGERLAAMGHQRLENPIPGQQAVIERRNGGDSCIEELPIEPDHGGAAAGIVNG